MPTQKSRETARETEVEKSWARFCWKSEAKKGSDALQLRADDVEGRVEEELGVADEGDASLADRSEVVEEVAIEHDERDADHERERELEPL